MCLWPQDIYTSSGSMPLPNIAFYIVNFTEIVSNNGTVMPSIDSLFIVKPLHLITQNYMFYSG